MNKQAFLEETYNSAFEDELEKMALLTPKRLLGKVDPSKIKKFYNIMSKGEKVPLNKAKDLVNKGKSIVSKEVYPYARKYKLRSSIKDILSDML